MVRSLDFIGIKDFWSSVALGFLNSLQVRVWNGTTQYDRLVLRVAKLLDIDQELTAIAERWRGRPHDLVLELVRLFTTSLSSRYPQETTRFRDVVTALILLISEDLDCHSIAHGWLQGMTFDADDIRRLGFKEDNSPIKVVQGLSWIMSLVGPTLIAVDQIDAIVTASVSAARTGNNDAGLEKAETQSIVDALAQGLLELHDIKHRAVTVISCLEATWTVLEDKTAVPMTDRYKPPVTLRALSSAETARALVTARLTDAYTACGFEPPYPTWPFADAALESSVGLSPRQLLKACDRHQQTCLAAGTVMICDTFDPGASHRPPDDDKVDGLDLVLQRALAAAETAGLLGPEGENKLQELLDRTLRVLEKHYDLPDDIDSAVQRDPDQIRPSLHGRLSFTFRSEGDREQHYCFRILEHTNPRAFQTRLKAAMTASGIDTKLKFRHLFILRRSEAPGGKVTGELVQQFLKAGGKFVAVGEDDLRILVALAAMDVQMLPGFDAWLRRRQPLFGTPLFKEAGLCPPPFLASRAPEPDEARPAPQTASDEPKATPQSSEPGPPPAPAGASTAKGSTKPAKPPQTTAGSDRLIPIGRRYAHGALGEPVILAADLLPRHVAVLAGPGSGKTVLLRRLIEEAALLGIPSIVLDPNNDLSRLGDAWPVRPETWSDEDMAKADAYHACADVVIWTPGVTSGNPISLDLLPDFAAIGDKQDSGTEDERTQAVEMARATLAPYLAGGGQKANLKQGVLADALRRFAKFGGGTLDELITLLTELPEDVSKIGNASKLAQEIANQLLAAIATNPLLQSQGQSLDPKALFEGPNDKTRVSVINLAGLASDDARDSFVNRLQMSLFTYIKQHPSPTGCLYVIDEAQNFAPSGAGTACKASALSLAAQARKYGLGMLFATQTPKGLDNKIVSNCTTHIYGRMGASATIDAVKEMMAAKGGTADDIGKLSRGEFYFSTEGSLRPFKVRTPLCLSWHPANPATAEEVVQKARAKHG
ncbi:hypothetical protein CCR97_09445 [Rhodoplanes elegans]|uniref:AAA+ ATPase domain-containing protein n=1 Tax=Rhodoplanes elegans TaxID=29408 RepID=A0A327KS78_9BRAD|nr:ATP-binding protein [Rhodoplanes elegans]MBK5958431.1 hypothetical protein [Rhodoplanes elegans]RAI41147.1 hypothetical protein CH338_04070 [Rhodoplanes elegans]